MVYQKTFKKLGRRDLLRCLRAVLEYFKPKYFIQRMVSVHNDTIMWYLSLKLIFCKSADVTIKADPAITFKSEVFRSINDQRYVRS